MPFLDLLQLAFRNLREAKLRATLTSMGVIVGVAVIVTMVSFGLGLQRNLLSRFKALDLFSEMSVYGKTVSAALNRSASNRRGGNGDRPPGPRIPENETPTRILDDAALAEIAKIPGVLYVEPAVFFGGRRRPDRPLVRPPPRPGRYENPDHLCGPAHWELLRALVGEHADDLFIAEDSYQRIYGQRVTFEGPAASAVLDEVMSQMLDAKADTAFGRELADLVTAPASTGP